METSYKNFREYLNNLGILSLEDCQELVSSKDKGSSDQLILVLKNVIQKQFKEHTHMKCTEIFDKYYKNDDIKIMKIIKRLMRIYEINIKKRKISTFLKWACQIENINNHDKKAKSIKISLSERKIKVKSAIKDYSRNDSKLKSSSSVVFMTVNKQNRFMNNNNSMSITKVDNFSLSSRKDSPTNKSTSKKRTKGIYTKRKRLDIPKPKPNQKEKKNTLESSTIVKYNKEDKIRFYETLHICSMKLKEKIRKMILEKEAKIDKQCTFMPKLYKSKSSANIRTTDFLTRLTDYEQLKKKKFNHLREEVESLRPKPNIKALSSSKSKEEILRKINNALCNYSRRKRERQRKMEATLFEEKGITFKPILNDKRNKTIKDTFSIRTETFIKKKNDKINYVYSPGDSECTFLPTVNNSPKNNNLQNDQMCVSERLYDYKNRYAMKRESMKVRYEETYSFKPVISKNTHQILQNKNKEINNIIRNKRNLNIISERQTQEQYSDDTICNLENDKSKSIQEKKKKVIAIIQSNNNDNEKLKMFGKSLNDDNKALEMAKMYMSVDDSLSKFQNIQKHIKQGKYKANEMLNKGEVNLKEHKVKTHNDTNYKDNNFMCQMDYYDNIM